MSARFDLAQPLQFDVGPGDPVSSEFLLAYTTLLFFAAGLVDTDPRDLTLGSLVRHLQGQGGQHPMRRHNDPRPGGLPLVHPPSCACAICATRRRQVTA